ncbi:fatty acid hydroxylase family protein [Leptospira gomenensis]|uniref:Fatty acid hydroxylase family protein n=1 Tax=Leptospira gomenensis TaxID=2484974 RepID=A0A5F1YSU9_9LEPT|nr:sterol desaturase family protein [Leptospira gomenensis]TGK31780.1 fatty acid hydroxylase family protein [Leptospira gomenensis]TGK41592.1 fatty acid hydroxylase family protein [Leptospira gomenensis]TGK44427.1 fatty acid hydroxylase family protein [Leptospira gomenensis]TGK61448.1 fatty acid hydroxylase family protein [Leptospira gomenensis]
MDLWYIRLIVVVYVCFALLEEAVKANEYPKTKFWKLRGAVSTLCYLTVAVYAPLFWDEWLAENSVLDLTSFPIWVSLPIAFLSFELCQYVWHRTMHTFSPIWRVFHQMHHSAESFDVHGAFYFSLADMIGFTFLASFSLVFLIGVPANVAIWAGLLHSFLSIFQHANLKTPRWLGFLIHRPENHALHHAKGVHSFNYGNTPIFDFLFGTFKNPDSFPKEVGFYEGASLKVLDMHLAKDVTKP